MGRYLHGPRLTLAESLLSGEPSAETRKAWSTHLGREVTDAQELRRELSSGPTLSQAFDRTSEQHGASAALTVGDQTLSHREVREHSEAAAGPLYALGLEAGAPVIIVADVDMTVVLAYLGSLRIGAVVTFADPSYTHPELRQLVAATGAHAILATGSSLESLDGASLDCPVYGLKASDQTFAGESPVSRRRGAPPARPADPEFAAMVALTSGSTGEPKSVPLSHRNLLTSIRGAAAAWRWTNQDRLVHCLPIGHQHGLGGIHISLLTGSHTVVLSHFDPEFLLGSIHAHHASVLFAVPSIYQRLAHDVPRDVSSLSELRLMVSGSAPLPPALATRIEELSGQMPLERYGSTETGLNVSNPYQGRRVPGTVGLPLPGVEIALVSPDADVAVGDVGEVVVRGPQVFSGYRGSPTGDSEFVHGWFRTGDLGRIDGESGHLELVGRAKEVIISGGMNVHPREVENALRTIRGVVDAAVIGIPSQRWGETVTAFVVTQGVARDDISTALRQTLAPYKRPKEIVLVEAIPRNEMGKVRRDLLAASLDPHPS